MHQAFDLGDRATVSLDLYGEYTIEPWAGNNILIETNVLLYNSTSSVLKHFVEKDLRYAIDSDTTVSGTILLASHDKKRISLRTKTGAESTEVITTKVFVPEDFIIQDQRLLVREPRKE
ncbi:MAG: hypothetical protein IPN76_30310 [Saprospiraceae bacterium]|nr:hypothetical protein [Saprospiraceae bacterium]